MKKTLILALALTMVASLSFAANARFVQPNATFANGGAATTNNDDSCDIAVVPAATLLLPFFEVGLGDIGAGPTTNFAITNTSNIPQVAHVTVWSNWSYPVLDFNIFLTGYDVAPVNLYDIIARGVLPTTGSGTGTSPRGSLSATTNANWVGAGGATTIANCAAISGTLPTFLQEEIRSGLTGGSYFDCDQIGSDSENAIGYVTIDVTNNCTQSLPIDPDYYTTEILFDNVFIGEYFRIDPRATTGNYAGGNPLVHIRAIPEGGVAGSTVDATVNFPFTFYDRYTTGLTKADRRQPLPGTFGARYIYAEGESFDTQYAIWREGELAGTAAEMTCPGEDLTNNAFIPFSDMVRFDEQENPTFLPGGGCTYSPCTSPTFTLPEASNRSVSDTTAFPPDNTTTSNAGGWMYLNLNHGQALDPAEFNRRAPFAGRSQNWVTVQMTAFGRYGVDFDAAYISNGCSVNPVDITAGNPINTGAAGNVTPVMP